MFFIIFLKLEGLGKLYYIFLLLYISGLFDYFFINKYLSIYLELKVIIKIKVC